MLSQADVKRVRALHQKKYREESGRFLAQGRKVVLELLGSPVRTEALFATEEAAAWLASKLHTRKLPLQIVAPHQLEKLGTLEKGNELVAVAVTPEAPVFHAPGPGELMLALDGV